MVEIRRAMPVVVVDDPDAARNFYVGYLGLRVAMDEPGMLMLASTTTPTTQVIVAWPTADTIDPELLDVHISLEVSDVDAAYRSAQAQGLAITREIRDEPWGIRRFFVRDPSGRVVNVASHIRR